MEIKLERWKEVIRVEFDKDKHFKNFVTDLGSICFDNKHGNTIAEHITLYIENEDSNYIYFLNKFLDTFLQMVEEHNNSIKDDGYKWICKGCINNKDYDMGCKNKSEYQPANHSECFLMGHEQDWQKITNKEKIEIIEED